MKINDNTNLSLPIRNLVALIFVICSGLWGYFGVVERLNKLETADQLMESDLLKKAEQTPKNLEIYMLIEMNSKLLAKHQEQLDLNIHSQIMIKNLEQQVNKILSDLEKLKDAQREIKFANGNSH
jgi:hypothetical protein